MSERAQWADNRHRPRNEDEQKILATEFDTRFVDLMQSAMCLSYYKYGAVAEGFPLKVDALKNVEARLAKYRETGNVEWLVDAANFCMIEFMHPAHPAAHFTSTDSDQSPGRFGQVDAAAVSPSQHQHRFLGEATAEEVAAKFGAAPTQAEGTSR